MRSKKTRGIPRSCSSLKWLKSFVSAATETIKPSIDLEVRYCKWIDSRSNDSRLWEMMTLYPFLYAIDSIPSIACEKKLLAISETITPIERLLRSLRLKAIGLG